MVSLKEIQAPVSGHLKEFDIYFNETLKCDDPTVSKILKYVQKTGGKKMRPLFVLLCAAINGNITKESYIAATLIEMMHTASLIHDDIVDESFYRRGLLSVNVLWGSKRAVLIGDYILSKSIKVASDNKCFDIIQIMSRVMQDMTLGEMLQYDSSESLNLSKERYFEVIRCKTGVLIGACAEAGAVSSNASKENIETLSEFGNMLGLAFQIKDDILDYGVTNIIGKPCLNDIRSRKMTLPLILAIENVSKSEQKKILNCLRKVDLNKDNVKKIYNFVIENKGLEKSYVMMKEIKDKTLLLLSKFPESQYKEALIGYANYVLERNK